MGVFPSKDCPCPINHVQDIFGNFSLFCGSGPFKIFESDVPTEMFFQIGLQETLNEDLCDLRVTIEQDDDSTQVFTIQNPNVSEDPFENNSIQFYSDIVRQITIECLGERDTFRCEGFWLSQIFLRGSNKDLDCECPVFVQNRDNIPSLPGSSANFSLACGSDENTVFESNDPVDIIGQILLNTVAAEDTDSCELRVVVDRDNGNDLVFQIPNPNTSPTTVEQNSVFYYATNTRRVTLECLGGSGNGCQGVVTTFLVLRAANR